MDGAWEDGGEPVHCLEGAIGDIASCVVIRGGLVDIDGAKCCIVERAGGAHYAEATRLEGAIGPASSVDYFDKGQGQVGHAAVGFKIGFEQVFDVGGFGCEHVGSVTGGKVWSWVYAIYCGGISMELHNCIWEVLFLSLPELFFLLFV